MLDNFSVELMNTSFLFHCSFFYIHSFKPNIFAVYPNIDNMNNGDIMKSCFSSYNEFISLPKFVSYYDCLFQWSLLGNQEIFTEYCVPKHY